MAPVRSARYHPILPSSHIPGRYEDQASEANGGSQDEYDEEDVKEWGSDDAGTAAQPCPNGRLEQEGQQHGSSWAWARRASALRLALDTVLLLVILGLLVEGRGYSRCGEHEFAGDITGFAPRFSQQITKFTPDPLFVPENLSDFSSATVQNRWLGLVPRGLGYVVINDTTRAARGNRHASQGYDNLPTPLETYPPSTFTTSMTHQLHCLHAIIGAVAGLQQTNGTDGGHGGWHLSHCFEYLRQSIMCCGDVALEGQATTFPPGFVGSDGWDGKHVCKDYGQILGYLDANRLDDEVWI